MKQNSLNELCKKTAGAIIAETKIEQLSAKEQEQIIAELPNILESAISLVKAKIAKSA